MKLHLPSLLLALLFMGNASTCFSQSKEELNDSLVNYFKANEFRKAITVVEKIIELDKKEFGEISIKVTGNLNNLAFLHVKLKEYSKAELVYNQVIKIKEGEYGKNHLEYIKSLNDLYDLYILINKNEKAESVLNDIVLIKEKLPQEDYFDFAATLMKLAELNEFLGKHHKAEKLYLQAADVVKKAAGENHLNYGGVLNDLAMLYEKKGDYAKSETLYIKVIDILKINKREQTKEYAHALNNLATLYETTGRYSQSESLHLRTIEIIKKLFGTEHLEYSGSLNNLASLYSNMGEYSKAEEACLAAIAIRKKIQGEDHLDYAGSLEMLSIIYRQVGQFAKAEQLNMEANTTRKKKLGDKHLIYSHGLNTLGMLYEAMGDYSKAEPLYLEAKEIRKIVLGTEHKEYATSVNNLAVIYYRQKKYAAAEQLYKESIEIVRKTLGEQSIEYGRGLNNLATLYVLTANYEKAESFYLTAKKIWQKILGENHPEYATNLGNIGFLYMHMGQPAKAESFFLEDTRIETKNLLSVFNSLSEKEKGNFLANDFFLNNSNNSLVYHYRNASPEFLRSNNDLQLLLKSLSLNSSKNILDVVRNSNDSSLQKIFADWQSKKSILSQQYSLPVSNRRTDITQIEAAAETLEKELTRRSAAFKIQQQSAKIKTSDVQKGLQPGEVAIEFVKYDFYNKNWTDSAMYAAYILTSKDSTPVFVSLCEERQLQKLFDSAGSTATAMVNSFYRGFKVENKNANTLGAELYKLIWQPLEPFLKDVKKITYSPAGKLYSVAFHALPVDSNTVLMDKYQLQQYASTRQVVLRKDEKKNIQPQSIILFGDAAFSMDSVSIAKMKTNKETTSIYIPNNRGGGSTWSNLPGTAQEVKTIQDLFEKNKTNAKTFVQATASEENLKALSGNSPQILHIATHGFFLPEANKKNKENNFNNENTYTLADDPLLRTGLILSGGNYAWSGKTPIDGVEDGIATAYEISQLNLSNTELVVLSACETALGDVKGSEGVFGLQRAFKMAGVKKMIVSLWQVPDKETAELMTSFYSYWMKGKTINDSFAQAQADMRKKYSPFYWAAFVLVE